MDFSDICNNGDTESSTLSGKKKKEKSNDLA